MSQGGLTETKQCRCGHPTSRHRGKMGDGACYDCDCPIYRAGERLVCRNISDGREHGFPLATMGRFALLCSECRDDAASGARAQLRAAAGAREGNAQNVTATVDCEHPMCTREALSGKTRCVDHLIHIVVDDEGARPVPAPKSQRALLLEAHLAASRAATKVVRLERSLAAARAALAAAVDRVDGLSEAS